MAIPPVILSTVLGTIGQLGKPGDSGGSNTPAPVSFARPFTGQGAVNNGAAAQQSLGAPVGQTNIGGLLSELLAKKGQAADPMQLASSSNLL